MNFRTWAPVLATAALTLGTADAAIVTSKVFSGPSLLADVTGTQGGSVDASGSGITFLDQLRITFGTDITQSGTVLVNDIVSGDITFSINSGAAFNAAVQSLTNGVDNEVAIATDYVSSLGVVAPNDLFRSFETSFFLGQPGFTGTDFQGATIDRIEFNVENFNTVAGLDFLIYGYDYSVRIYGDLGDLGGPPNAVPLPAAAPLFAAVLAAGAGLFGRKKGKKLI